MNLSKLHFPEAPKMVTEPPGPKARGLLEAQERLESSAFKYPRSIPLALAEGRGATLKDVDGNIYIDFFAGIGVLNVGYSTPPVLEAARKQEEKLIHTLDFPTAPRIKLMERLNEIAPGRLKGSAKMLFGGPTGGDAIEGAIKLAKYNTERRPLIAFVGSYHGQTTAALSVTSGKSFKQDYLPLLADVHFLPYPYPYRPPLGSDPASCGVRCVEYLDDILKDPYSGVPEPAAIIVEPIQGEGGIIVPPDDFLPELARLAKDHSIPLIIDEIQTGFGRTGKMFACEHWDVTPDIMPLAKAVGGIGYPLSGCLYHQDLDTWGPGAHIGTFRGHAVAMAAGKAAIDFIQEHKLTEHAAKLGEYIKGRLEELQGETECIGDVRGKGLFIGIEFIKDRKTKEPYQEIVKEIQRRCFQKGLLIWTAGHYGNVVRFIPPLVITEELVQRGLNIFAQVVCEVTKLT